MEFAKERETNIIVKLSGTPGLMAEDTGIEQGLQNPEIKEVKRNTYSKAKWANLLWWMATLGWQPGHLNPQIDKKMVTRTQCSQG